jgi:glycosyltransferase involved in cell wall biosynthesis
MVNLLSALPGCGVRPYLYSNAPIHSDHLDRLPAGAFEVRIAPRMRYLTWEQLWIPRQCRADAIDVFHAPFNYGMPWSTHCPRVLTLHDAIDQVYYRSRSNWRNRWTPNSIRARLTNWAARYRAHQVITVSEHARGDLVHALGVHPNRVSVVYEAADPAFCSPVSSSKIDAVRTIWGLMKPYFFYVGGWEGRKNLPFLVRAFAATGLSDVDLVLAGGKDEQRIEFTKLANALGIGDRLRLLGSVPDADLPALYAGAHCFVYPSEYEGFGLQLVEAMAVGCPILAARATCLPEILGNGGATFTLEKVEELSALLARVATDPPFRADLSQRAMQRARDFSWERSAQGTVTVYRRTVRAGSN